MKHESKNIRENEASENPSPMQQNKQINETKKMYKPCVTNYKKIIIDWYNY